jgi:phosphoribosylamine--glycine ligase
MKILVIGSGCREHALAWKFAQSEKVEKIYIAPGNGGTAIEGKCGNVPLNSGDAASPEGQQELVQFALREKIALSVVGPELPLAQGIVDRFRAAGLNIIGPDQKAARLEASKAYSKEFMQKYGVRTAKSESFSDAAAAKAYAKNHFNTTAAPLVIKADGLAAGKGVVVAQNFAEADAALCAFMENKSLGEAGNLVLLEEFIGGKEVSVLAAVSVAGGKGHILPFISARDHKRRFDGARGPNTGGMGAIAPVPDFTAATQSDFYASILEPSLNGMKTERLDYRGFIFFGLMIQNEKCCLLEYNVRLGDPETEAVLPLMDSSLVDLCAAIQEGRLESFNLKWKKGAACAPVAVADGYPGTCRKGDAVSIDWAALEKIGAKVFTGGVASGVSGGPAGGAAPALQTSGGRVLAVSALGANADEAWANAYRGLTAVSFEGMGYRRDIGREG